MELSYVSVKSIIDGEKDIAPETSLYTIVSILADADFKKVTTVENIYLHLNLVIEPSTADVGSNIVGLKFGNRSNAPDSCL